MFNQLAHLFGLKKKDEALEKRFAQIKARYGGPEREELDVLNHVRSGLDSPHVVGSTPLTIEELHKSFVDGYAKTTGEYQKSSTVTAAPTLVGKH